MNYYLNYPGIRSYLHKHKNIHMEENPVLKSRFQIEKEAEDMKIYLRFNELMEIPKAQILEVNKVIMQEFPSIHSPVTVWTIRKRVAKRLDKTI